ncbi:MAG: hypothetical protein U9Q08_01355 [Candidatus Omnitrophota bacterium]|nr:hypothetical protein [Candidatus Omnitrophota bacterium]
MGTKEAIKKGFMLAGKNWVLVGVLFLLNIFSNLIGLPLKSIKEGVSPSLSESSLAIGVIIIFLFLSIFVQAGLLGSVRDIIKKGSTRLNNLFSSGKKFFWRLLGLGMLIGLIIGLLVIFCQGTLALADRVIGNTILKSLGFFIYMILGIITACVSILFFYSPYVLVAEECGIIESVRKSVGFARKFLGSAMGTLALMMLMIIGATVVVGILLVPVAVSQRQMIGGILASGVNAYFGLVAMITFMSLYLGLTEEKK